MDLVREGAAWIDRCQLYPGKVLVPSGSFELFFFLSLYY